MLSAQDIIYDFQGSDEGQLHNIVSADFEWFVTCLDCGASA